MRHCLLRRAHFTERVFEKFSSVLVATKIHHWKPFVSAFNESTVSFRNPDYPGFEFKLLSRVKCSNLNLSLLQTGGVTRTYERNSTNNNNSLNAMSPRPGTDVAGRFFSDCVDAEEWLRVLEKYDESLEMVAKSKKKIELIELDNFWRKEFSAIVLERSPPHFTLPELSKIMAWKLLRGKFRPLQKMCDSNSPESVISASTAALKAMQGSKADWKSAMKSLTTLRAIGEATARYRIVTNCKLIKPPNHEDDF